MNSPIFKWLEKMLITLGELTCQFIDSCNRNSGIKNALKILRTVIWQYFLRAYVFTVFLLASIILHVGPSNMGHPEVQMGTWLFVFSINIFLVPVFFIFEYFWSFALTRSQIYVQFGLPNIIAGSLLVIFYLTAWDIINEYLGYVEQGLFLLIYVAIITIARHFLSIRKGINPKIAFAKWGDKIKIWIQIFSILIVLFSTALFHDLFEWLSIRW